MSRLRAVEHGRAVVVAATSGVSAIIAPDGRVEQRTSVFHPARLVADIPLRDPRTVADRLGAWPERGLAIVAGLVLLAAGLRGRWTRSRPVLTPAARFHEFAGRRGQHPNGRRPAVCWSSARPTTSATPSRS